MDYYADEAEFSDMEHTLLEVWTLSREPEPGEHTVGKLSVTVWEDGEITRTRKED